MTNRNQSNQNQCVFYSKPAACAFTCWRCSKQLQLSQCRLTVWWRRMSLWPSCAAHLGNYSSYHWLPATVHSATHKHTHILLTRLPDKYPPIYICYTSLKTHEKWLINIKSRNQICCKLAVREWLSQQSVLDRDVINTHPWHLFECYERMREGVTKEKRPSERGNSWLTPVTGWMFVFLFIRAAHLISLCLLEIILWKWNGNNPNESLSHCDLLSVRVDGPIWLVFAHGWQLISC